MCNKCCHIWYIQEDHSDEYNTRPTVFDKVLNLFQIKPKLSTIKFKKINFSVSSTITN